MKVVIVSRQRPKICFENSFQLAPRAAAVCVAEEEADGYVKAGIPAKSIVTHPNDVVGQSKKRNWVLRNFPDETIVMLDDHGRHFTSSVGQTYRIIKEEGAILRMLENAEDGARAVGTVFFGFNPFQGDIRKYDKFEPFSLVGRSNCCYGHIGKTIFYDENLPSHVDVDYALQVMLKYRVVWIDMRFSYVAVARTGYLSGGKNSFMSSQRERDAQAYMIKKWGPHYSASQFKVSGAVRSSIRVNRKMSVLVTPDKF